MDAFAHLIFHCGVCDRNTVSSNDPESGKFYRVFGYDSEFDFHSVVFAVCCDCQTGKACKPVDIEDYAKKNWKK